MPSHLRRPRRFPTKAIVILLPQLLNFTTDNSVFQIHLIAQALDSAKRKHLIPINTMNPNGFTNVNTGQAEESQLEPTQRQGEPYEGIFFEETPVDRTRIPPVPIFNGAAAPVQAPTAPVAGNPTMPVSLVMDGPVPAIEVPATGTDSGAGDGSLITLDYCLYVSTFNHLTSAKSKSKNKNDSKKIVPPKNALPSMRMNLHNRTWDEVRGEIIRIIGSSRKNLDVYIAQLLSAGQIRFHFYIPNSHAFPFKRNYYVTSEAKYQTFLEELVRKPNSKVFIRMVMGEPGAKAKCQEVIRHQDDSLAIAVGSKEEVINLERMRARHDQNPQLDLRGDPIAPLWNYSLGGVRAWRGNSQLVRGIFGVRDEERNNGGNIGITTPWVVRPRVHLENRANTRPSETIFIQDPKQPGMALRVTHEQLWAWARVLQQRTAGNITPANEHVDLDHPPTGANWVWERRGVISPIKSRTGPSTPLPGPLGRPSASSATPPAIFGNPAGRTPATPSAAILAPFAVTPSDPIGQRAASARPAPRTPLNHDIHPALVADDHSWIMNSLPSTIQGSADSSEIDFLQDASQMVVRRPSPASESSIKYLDDEMSDPIKSRTFPIDSQLGDAGPSRKVARSPQSPSPSPTRKRAPLPLPPLTKAGRRMTIAEFLIHCNIEEYDSMSHSIKHWCFFRGQTADDLMRIGFPRGLATQIYNGVLEVEVTMTTKPSDNPPSGGPSL
ncbi:hypothetical protein PSHT_10845 [Puccinia striiformis]|uniref:Uncharacterized protein n=1 Tax=Puccinia striiformis TaxID=27350 RepID=A0A2S4V6U9_9BASI|nr:hypothetical protein PSHT_10845 [Puccinia striiformis]